MEIQAIAGVSRLFFVICRVEITTGMFFEVFTLLPYERTCLVLKLCQKIRLYGNL